MTDERLDQIRNYFNRKVLKTKTFYHEDLPLTQKRDVVERPDGAGFVDELLEEVERLRKIVKETT